MISLRYFSVNSVHSTKTLPKTLENAKGSMLMPKGREWNIHFPLSVTKAIFSAIVKYGNNQTAIYVRKELASIKSCK